MHARSQLKVVRDRDHRLAPAFDHVAQDLEHLLARFRIQRAGRLVGENERRVVGQRARHRHALALPARELIRPLAHMLAKPKCAEKGGRALAHGRGRQRSERPHRQHHIVDDREFGQQEMELEDKAERGEPDLPALHLTHARGGAAADQHFAARRQIKQAQEIEERRLARPGRPSDGDEFPLADRKADVAHQGGGHDPRQDTRHLAGLDQRHARHVAPRIISTGCSRAARRAGT